MTACCPTDAAHKRFVTVAHVSQDWVVDERGNFLDSVGGGETVAAPQPENTLTCQECGAQAEITQTHHPEDGNCPCPSKQAIRMGWNRCEECRGKIPAAYSEPMFGL